MILVLSDYHRSFPGEADWGCGFLSEGHCYIEWVLCHKEPPNHHKYQHPIRKVSLFARGLPLTGVLCLNKYTKYSVAKLEATNDLFMIAG